MSWLAVDNNGTETIFNVKPIKIETEWWPKSDQLNEAMLIELPKGSIQKLIGRKLSNNETIEIK